MNEIYRSFEGKLNVDCQEGYILYTINDGELIEYEGLSVWQDTETERARIPARYLPAPEYANTEKISELIADCHNGTIPGGQVWVDGKWWSYDTIQKIQQRRQDNRWWLYTTEE